MLFNLPETYLLACLIDYFDYSEQYERTKTGVYNGELFMLYQSIFQDVRAAVDVVHEQGSLKRHTIENCSKYIVKDPRLPVLLDRMKDHCCKVFLLTNSEYWYTRAVMSYLLDTDDRPWKSYFDYIVVDAGKPRFFGEGTILRQVDEKSGALKIGSHTGPLKRGVVYSGGSCDVFSDVIGAKGKDVLYVGDHIFGDILKSKKIRGWRTFLVVPELTQELLVWTSKRTLYDKLQHLDGMLSALYKNMDSSSAEQPDITKIQGAIREVSHEMDLSHGLFGSLCRSGSRLTFFAAQVTRYADLYAASFLNLLYYPFSYMFRAPPMLMPHESTVDHVDVLKVDLEPTTPEERAANHFPYGRARSLAETPVKEDLILETGNRLERQDNAVPHKFAMTPRRLTHHHDEDDSDDENSSSSDQLRNSDESDVGAVQTGDV